MGVGKASWPKKGATRNHGWGWGLSERDSGGVGRAREDSTLQGPLLVVRALPVSEKESMGGGYSNKWGEGRFSPVPLFLTSKSYTSSLPGITYGDR